MTHSEGASIDAINRPHTAQGSNAVDDAMQVVLHVSSYPGLGVRAIARNLGMTPPRTLRILSSLERYKLLEKRDEGYEIGSLALDLGAVYEDRYPVFERIRATMKRIQDELHTSIGLFALDGTARLVLATEESPTGLRFTWRVGSRKSAHIGASGRTLLSQLDDEELERRFSGIDIPKVTDKTIGSYDELIQAVREVRRCGYAMSIAEGTPGVFAIAAPVCIDGQQPLAIASMDFEGAISDEEVEHRITRLAEHCRRLSNRTNQE